MTGNKYLLTIISALFYACSMAQSITPFVIASTGSFSAAPTFTLSSTLGEVMVKTETSADNILTQGFQQPGSTWTYIQQIDEGEISITVYPNPTTDRLTVEISSDKYDRFDIYILNLLGKKIALRYTEDKYSNIRIYTINTSALAGGIYMLGITSFNKEFQKVMKFNKLN